MTRLLIDHLDARLTLMMQDPRTAAWARAARTQARNTLAVYRDDPGIVSYIYDSYMARADKEKIKITSPDAPR